MIPLTREIPLDAPLPLAKVPDHLPGRGDRRVHVAAVHRWVRQGRRGVKLRAVRVRGKVCTTRVWLLQFLNSGAIKHGASATDSKC